jgi:hypothetical protein
MLLPSVRRSLLSFTSGEGLTTVGRSLEHRIKTPEGRLAKKRGEHVIIIMKLLNFIRSHSSQHHPKTKDHSKYFEDGAERRRKKERSEESEKNLFPFFVVESRLLTLFCCLLPHLEEFFVVVSFGSHRGRYYFQFRS